MLIGSRSGFIPEAELNKLMTRVSGLVGAKGCDIDLVDAVLHAIFELSRQGYLEAWNTPLNFFNWCRDFQTRYHQSIGRAWSSYRKELERVTYLDPLPSHWDNVRPKSWIASDPTGAEK
jgi:hypothetical protein